MPENVTMSLELMRRAQSGDAAALNRLLERYYERVLAIVRIRLGGLRAHTQSGDILQEVFLSVVRSYNQFEVRDESRIIAWLATMVQNEIRDAQKYFHSQKRHPAREVSLDATDFGDVEDSAQVASGIKRLQSEDERYKLQNAMAELSENQREVVILRSYVGLGWTEISMDLGIPSADAARQLFARTMIRLGVILRRREQSASGSQESLCED